MATVSRPKSPLVAPAPSPQVRNVAAFCPECGRSLAGHTPMPTPRPLTVCKACSAIVLVEPSGKARMLRTDEWYDAMLKPGYDPIYAERDRVLAALTEPASKAKEAS